MELNTITPDLPALLKELGMNYDPDRLASALEQSWPRVSGELATEACACLLPTARKHSSPGRSMPARIVPS